MAGKEEEFRKRLLATFKVEAEDHLNAITAGLLELEKAPTAEKHMQIIETVFREAHSLKGAARAVDISAIEVVCQSLEKVFATLKKSALVPSASMLDRLHFTTDELRRVLSCADEPSAIDQASIADLVRNLERAAPAPQAQEAQIEARRRAPETAMVEARPASQSPLQYPASDTIRIPTARLESILRQAEEFVSAKLVTSQISADLTGMKGSLESWRKEWEKLRPVLRALEKTPADGRKSHNGQRRASHRRRLLEFLEWNEDSLKGLEGSLAATASSAENNKRALGRMIDALLGDMKKVVMLPFSSLFEIVPKLCRDLARDTGKEIGLSIQGGEIEIDRRILEELKDPLIHLLRNSVDHGIEAPEQRLQTGKPRHGTIAIHVSAKDGGKIELVLSDDGRGIDVESIRSSARGLGLVTTEGAAGLDDKAIAQLIFQSGVSSSATVTEISGRGLGLAIVREKIEKAGGHVTLEAQPGLGATFRILLPVTLATFRGILVRAADRLFVLPTADVERVVKIDSEGVKTIENRETILIGEQPILLLRLDDTLEIRTAAQKNHAGSIHVVIIGLANRRFGFVVEEVFNEQEVLLKPLGKQLARVRNIAGATVLGSGQVVPVINVPDLVKSALRRSAMPVMHSAAPKKNQQAEKKSVLIVEDSITSRALLKNILETAGYRVAAACDGIDGFTQLRNGDYDIVISDVDMPRMNGFDLTAKIRADKKLAAVPLVLLTSLDSREDRERGIDVGASAYIVKSSFDQSNLLEVIRRLI
jgi:two-component system chemotaxis sensor kinase CheA